VTRTASDAHFTTGSLFRLTAAVAGISRKGWTAISEPDADEEHARKVMNENRFDVLPIESDRGIGGYFHTLTWNDYSKVVRADISDGDLIPYKTDVRDVIRHLAEQARRFFFLSDASDVVGLISVVNLNRRPVKVWLFNLLSEIELGLGDLLSQYCEDREIYDLTLAGGTEPKYGRIKKRYEADRKHGLELPVVEYLYFSDIVRVALRKGLYTRLNYTKQEFERSLGSLADLRDAVAHPARSLIREPDAVSRLWRRIQRIEDGLERLRRGPTKASTRRGGRSRFVQQ
jgi:hypothetical protein